MSGDGMIPSTRADCRPAQSPGRWPGLFKLSEECGELIVATIDLVDSPAPIAPALIVALQDEIADVGAACVRLVEAGGLDAARIGARERRQIEATPSDASKLDLVVRRAGALVQLLGKVAAFPGGDEHPDGAGNLGGRIEAGIADLTAALSLVSIAYRLDLAAIEARGADKLRLFRQWCPANRHPGMAR